MSGSSAASFRTSRIITGDEHMGTHDAPDWLVDGIIQRSRLYALTSLTAHGKTAVALYLACMIHNGRMVGKLDTFKGNVLYLAGENPDDIAARMFGMCKHFNFGSLDMPFVVAQGFPLDEAEADSLIDEIDSRGEDFALIIGDTAASFFCGEDENSNTEAGNQARIWRRLTKARGRPAVMPLCHPIKDATRDKLRPRGGGAFLNELDANLTLWSTDVGNLTTLHWLDKIRGPAFEPLDFRLHQLNTGKQDSKGRDEPTIVAVPIDEAEATNYKLQAVADEDHVLRVKHEHPAWSLREVAIDLNWLNKGGEPEKQKVQRAVKALEAAGLLKQLRNMGPYRATDKGKAVLMERFGKVM